MPFARMFDLVGITFSNMDNDITQDAPLMTDTPVATSSQNDYKATDTLSNNNQFKLFERAGIYLDSKIART